MNKLYPVQLTDAQVTELQHLIRIGTAPARVHTRARLLLLAHQGATDQSIAHTLFISPATVARIRQRFVQHGLAVALQDQPRPGRPPMLTGEVEAHLIALACSAPPDGRARWTLQLLADRLVTLGVVETISDEAVRERLKKTKSSRG
jgi:transposase